MQKKSNDRSESITCTKTSRLQFENGRKVSVWWLGGEFRGLLYLDAIFPSISGFGVVLLVSCRAIASLSKKFVVDQ